MLNDKINDKINEIINDRINMFKESEVLELKRSLSQLKEGIISMSSMLNKKGRGTVYFGINDESKVVGLTIGNDTRADVVHEIQNNLKPIPSRVTIDIVTIENKPVIKVEVEGNDTPYSAYNRYYIRINDADISMNNHELQKYFEEKDNTYSKWENKETMYGINDVDEDLLIDCIRTSNEKGRLDYVYKNRKHALIKLGLLTENGFLNNAGWYLFGNNKPLTIKLANYPTDSRVDFGEIKEFKGNIFECMKESISYIQNHITFNSKIEGIQRLDIPEIPLRAIREIVINSFAHCNYQIKGDFNEYVIFKSYVKIYNPGGIIKDVDPMRFAKGEVGSKIRNILIASTLFKCGYIDSFGTGFDRTFNLCLQNDIKFRYQNDEFGFTFVFKRKNETSSQNDEKLDDLDIKILNKIKEDRYITINELAELFSKSEITIYRHLDALSEDNYLQRRGSRKSGYWEILK